MKTNKAVRHLTVEECKKVEDNIGLARHIAYRLFGRGCILSYEDCCSIAKYGLLKAVTTFDESRGYSFATYAARIMHNEILMEIRRENMVNGYTHNKIISSLDKAVTKDDGFNTEDLHLIDVISDAEDYSYEEVDNRIDGELTAEYVLGYLKRFLSLDEFQCMQLRTRGLLQWEIAEELGWSQSYVSRLLRRARAVADRHKEEILLGGKQ